MDFETDASAFVIDMTLIIQQLDRWQPAAYMSHSLFGAELNWSIYDKELFAIIYMFKTWHHWLLLSNHKIEVWCDHQNLLYFRKPQQVMARQA